MKKSLLVLASCLAMSSAMAEGEKSAEVKKEKPIISNGFFLHFGLGFPAAKYGSISQSLGIQPSLEIGNQWYFVKNEHMGVGIKVSWLQFGYSQKSKDVPGNTSKTGLVDFRFLKIAPMFSYALNDDMALDAYVDIAPTILVSGTKNSNVNMDASATFGAGVLFAPGLRFRYHKLALGFDVSLGSISTASTKDVDVNNDGINEPKITYKNSYFIPRVYVGFKF